MKKMSSASVMKRAAMLVMLVIACFALSALAAAVLTYGFERPAAKRLQAIWNMRRAQKEA